MRKRLFIALILILMLVPMSIAAANEKPLRFETTYSFDGGAVDPEGRIRVWVGTVSGTFDGTIEWWMYFPGGTDTGKVNHWENAQWIIYPDEGGFIMGEEWGSTTWIPGFERANWRANGRVTDASEGYEYLIDRPMHDGGKVVLSTFPFYGTGKLHINK